MRKITLITYLTASLQRKLMLALMAIATFVIGVGGIYLLSSLQRSVSAGLEARAIYMANMLSQNLSLPMWDMNLKSIQDQIDMVMFDPEIYSVALYEGEQKQPLTLKKRDGQAVDGIERETSVVYVGDPSKPPVNLGRLRIVYTRSYMYQALRQTHMMILAGILFLLASLSAAIYILLRRVVQKPVGELLAMANRIAEGDLEARIPVTSRDEIGLLCDKFNDMTDKLKQTMDGLSSSEQNYRNINVTLEEELSQRRQTETELQRYQQNLEDLVKSRTSELSKIVEQMNAEIAERNKIEDALKQANENLGSSTADLQQKLGEMDNARKAMLNIMEDLEVAKKETEARNAQTQELLKETQRQAEELKIQQEHIKEAEERSRTILDAISVGTMIIHPKSKIIVDVNPVGAGIIGLAREDIIGKTCHKFVCPKEEQQCPITDLGQKIDNSERVILNAEGKEIPVIKTVTSLMLGDEEFLLESFVDITERKEIEKKLLESSEQIRVLSNVVEQSPLSVMITNREGIIEYVNPKFASLTGYDATEIRGSNPRILKSGKHDQAFYADLWETILSSREWHGQICNRKKSGELYWERASISSIHGQTGDITQFVSIREDFTEQMRMEAELKERMEELKRFNKLTIKREEKMISLKEEINALLLQMDKEAKYKIVE